MTEKSEKPCIACGADIPHQAILCNQCSSYQSAWKNQLRYIANVIGVFSVAAGAIIFILSALPQVRQVVAWRDQVQVLTFASNKPIAMANTGDGGVFVTDIHISGVKPSGSDFSQIERFGNWWNQDKSLPLIGQKAHLPI